MVRSIIAKLCQKCVLVILLPLFYGRYSDRVAPHATVGRGTCKHNVGPDILLLVRSPTILGGQSWTPPRHFAPTWRVRLEAKSVKVILVYTRARTSDTSAPSAARRSAPAKAPRFTG